MPTLFVRKGGDEQFGGKVGVLAEPAVKLICSGLQSSAVMTAYWPESAFRG